MLDFILGKIRGIYLSFFTLEKKSTLVSGNTVSITNNFSIVTENYSSDVFEKINKSHLEKLSNGIGTIPKENLEPLKPYNSYRAIQALYFLTQEELSEWFIELLVKSADSRYSNKVKARYQEILSVLEQDDAKLLEFIFKGRYIVNIKKGSLIDVVDKPFEKHIANIPENPDIPFSVEGIPFLEIRNESNKTSAGWKTIHKIFTDVNKLPVNKSIKEVESQLEHLSSLGLIEIKPEYYFLPTEIYTHLENNEHILGMDKTVGDQRSIKKIKGRIDLTTLGKDFLSIVLKNE